MFVKINEEESEDEGSDQETSEQLEMESRHSENYGQTESDGQTENGETESDGQAKNGQAESDGQAENVQAENEQMESEKDTTGLDNSLGPLEGTDDMYFVERIVGKVKVCRPLKSSHIAALEYRCVLSDAKTTCRLGEHCHVHYHCSKTREKSEIVGIKILCYWSSGKT